LWYRRKDRLHDGRELKVLLKKVVSTVTLILLFTNGSMLLFDAQVHAEASDTYLFVSPPTYVSTNKGEKFEETVGISSPEELRSVEFAISYDHSLLDVANVTQGPFFPLPPKSNFEFEKNESTGLLKVTLSLIDLKTSISGNGTLASVVFEVTGDSGYSMYSAITLEQILILNSALNPVGCESIGAVYFWKSIQPDPPSGGRMIDVCTQRAGVGLNEPGGEFAAGEGVILDALVTYNGFPVQHDPVAFQVLDPANHTLAILTAFSDNNGIAEVRFTIPYLPSSEGVWTVVATVEIASETVFDTVTFRVLLFLAVGGYTFQIKIVDAWKQSTLYLNVLVVSTTLFMVIKRKTTIRKKRLRKRTDICKRQT
jgi:hypothetical protein